MNCKSNKNKKFNKKENYRSNDIIYSKKTKFILISVLLVLISSMGMGMIVAHDTGSPHSHGDEVTTEDTKKSTSNSKSS